MEGPKQRPNYRCGFCGEGVACEHGYCNVCQICLECAMRLARREDADALAEMVDDCWKVAEHMWPESIAPQGEATPVEVNVPTCGKCGKDFLNCQCRSKVQSIKETPTPDQAQGEATPTPEPPGLREDQIESQIANEYIVAHAQGWKYEFWLHKQLVIARQKLSRGERERGTPDARVRLAIQRINEQERRAFNGRNLPPSAIEFILQEFAGRGADGWERGKKS